jgi:hypothetical protein
MVKRSVGPDTHRRYGELPGCWYCPVWDWTLEGVHDDPDGELAVFRCSGCDRTGTLRVSHDTNAPREYHGAFEMGRSRP